MASSSSGTVHSSPYQATSPQAPGADEVTAVLAPHSRSCYLDYDHSEARWVLTNRATQEVVALDAGEWSLGFDPNGYGILDSSAGQTLEAKDVFELALYEDSFGRQVIVEHDEEHLEGEWRRYLDVERYRFVVGDFEVRVGAGGGRSTLRAAILTWPRGGCRVFWSLISVYAALALNLFKGVASRWAFSGFASGAWASFLLDLGFRDQLLKSQPYDNNDIAKDDSERFLPFMAVSSLGLLTLLVRWWVIAGNRGGFRERDHKHAAQELVTALILFASSAQGAVLDIRLDDEASWDWPRPLLGQRPCQITLESGMLGLGEFLAAQNNIDPLAGVRAKWWLQDCLDEGQVEISATEVLAHLMKQSLGVAHPLFIQLLMGIGLLLDQRSCEVSDGANDARLQFSADDDVDLSAYQEGKLMDRHMTATRKLMQLHSSTRHFSFCTDKARVGGLELSSTFCVFPDGHCVEMFPQAAPGPTDTFLCALSLCK